MFGSPGPFPSYCFSSCNVKSCFFIGGKVGSATTELDESGTRFKIYKRENSCDVAFKTGQVNNYLNYFYT